MIAGTATIIIMGSVFRATTIITSPFMVESEMGLAGGLDSPVAVQIINSLLRSGIGLAEEIG
jgi:hypothetical protein